MGKQKAKETWETWQAKSHTREAKLKTALYNGGGNMDFVATSMIHAALWPLYASGRLSDLTVICNERHFKVHKAIVCSQSPFFDKACNGGFKEGVENIIELPEEDADIVDLFFQFLYAGNYADGEHFHSLPSKSAMMTPGAVMESLQTSSLGENKDSEEALDATLLADDIGDDDHHQTDSKGVANDKQNDDVWEDYESDEEYTSEQCSADEAEEAENEDPLERDSETSRCTNPDGLYDSGLLADKLLNKNRLPPYVSEYHENYPVTSIITSLRVYVMADKYDVPALRLLAKERFTCTVANYWLTYGDFPAVVDELFETTMPNDPLQAFICELVVCQYHIDADLRARMRPVMEKHSGFSLGLLDKMVVLTHM